MGRHKRERELRHWHDKTDGFPGGLATVSPDGQTLLYHDCDSLKMLHTGGVEVRLTLRDLTTRAEPRKLTGPGYYPMDLAFTNDGKWLVSLNPHGDPGTEVQVRDLSTGELRHRHLIPRAFLYKLAIASDGRRIAVAGNDRLIRVIDPVLGKTLQTFSGHDGWITALAFSPDGKWLVSGSAEAPMFI